jgi:acetylornithine deacetylase/succinyl-diaminopimelate desuccinylase-like protein
MKFDKALLFLSVVACPLLAAPAPDFDAAAKEAVPLLQTYLRINTTNPPGHERKAAEFFKAIFDREGIENEIYDQGDDRADILARLPGNGRKRPLILLNHMDVVPAEAARWKVPPFSGELKDGYIWGRGATDMKGTAICQLMTVLLLKRSGAKLDRDVIFLGTADEEEGTSHNGVHWMLENAKEKLRNAEFVLTEGNTLSVENGKTTAWNVDVTEKSILWLKMIATGKAGHASIPEPEGAVAHLVRAVNRILSFEPPVRLIPAVEAYFKQLSRSAPDDLKPLLSDPSAALNDPVSRKKLLEDPFRNACLRETISVTGLSGSSKVNVIPGEATATLDVRLLPGDKVDEFLATLKSVAGDPSIRFEVISSGIATESSTDSELFRAIGRARDRLEPGVPILTPPLTSTTDSSLLRQAGLVAYGFEPFHLAEDDDHSHGDNERISPENIRFGLEVTHFVVSDVAGAR